MSHKTPTQATGKGYSRAEAMDVLSQCKAIRWSLDALEGKAYEALRKPELRVVDGGIHNHSEGHTED
jgi:hypothetical protein